MNKRTFFTIPFAGGNKFAFKKYSEFLEDDFTIYPLELAGRGERFSEDLMSDIYKVRDDLFNQIKENIDGEYIIYGHSLGGLLGYLLVVLLQDRGLPLPTKLIISGRANPSMKPSTIKHNLSKDDFINSLKKLGGMPSDFFNHPELFEFFEPILRADFQIAECFDFKEKRKVNTKITVLYGKDESFSIMEAMRWREFTTDNYIDFHEFQGDHFFIYNNIETICKIIRAT